MSVCCEAKVAISRDCIVKLKLSVKDNSGSLLLAFNLFWLIGISFWQDVNDLEVTVVQIDTKDQQANVSPKV